MTSTLDHPINTETDALAKDTDEALRESLRRLQELKQGAQQAHPRGGLAYKDEFRAAETAHSNAVARLHELLESPTDLAPRLRDELQVARDALGQAMERLESRFR